VRTYATSCIWETSLQNCQKLRESLGNIGIFLLLKSNFPHTKFDFLQRLFAFFNGFLLSSMAFQFSSTAFNFLRNPRKSIYVEKYTKDHYLSFVFFATCSPSFVIPAKQYLCLTQHFEAKDIVMQSAAMSIPGPSALSTLLGLKCLRKKRMVRVLIYEKL
jgi:hypothetical protein